MSNPLLTALSGIAKDSHLFCLLTDDELARVADHLETKQYKSREVIFREGEPGNFIAIISSGKVSVSKATEFAGKDVILATNGKGSFIGELSTIDEQPRSATVTTLEDTEILILTREAIEDLNRSDPSIGLRIYKGLIRVLGLRLRQSAARISQIF